MIEDNNRLLRHVYKVRVSLWWPVPLVAAVTVVALEELAASMEGGLSEGWSFTLLVDTARK